MERYIDTHVHLYDEAFDEDLPEVMARIRDSGVVHCIFPGIDRSTFRRQSECAARYRGAVSEAVGLHPTSVKQNWKEELAFVKERLSAGSETGTGYVAVGEIGLDGYWSRDFMREQMEVFREQLRMACRAELPVIIHSREATEEIFEVLESVKSLNPRGVFHAFSGSAETYRRLSGYGDFYVGIGGVVTYKNAGVARALEQIPLERILLETDAPWLTPVPHRGTRNESSYIPVIAAKIAEVKKIPVEEVAAVTTSSARQLFNLPLA